MHDYVKLHQNLEERVRNSAQCIAPIVTSWIQPRTVLDVGCGNGTWLRAFELAGVAEIFGVDGDYLDPQSLEIPRERFYAHDLTKPLHLNRRFDLVVSLEVAEHLPESAADLFVESLVRHGSLVLFSAAVPRQGGVNHLNEQWPSYWQKRFASHGFDCLEAVRPIAWERTDVLSHYAQNAFLYLRESDRAAYPGLAQFKQPQLLDIIHPEQWERHTRPVPIPSISVSAGLLGQAVRRRIQRLFGLSLV